MCRPDYTQQTAGTRCLGMCTSLVTHAWNSESAGTKLDDRLQMPTESSPLPLGPTAQKNLTNTVAFGWQGQQQHRMPGQRLPPKFTKHSLHGQAALCRTLHCQSQAGQSTMCAAAPWCAWVGLSSKKDTFPCIYCDYPGTCVTCAAIHSMARLRQALSLLKGYSAVNNTCATPLVGAHNPPHRKRTPPPGTNQDLYLMLSLYALAGLLLPSGLSHHKMDRHTVKTQLW